tara:strand:- start:702 stop:1061 length:360 start_codon:yes stop_codon:yes gene_type:complete
MSFHKQTFHQKEVFHFYPAKSYEEGVKHIKSEYQKMGRNARDMSKEQLERITFVLQPNPSKKDLAKIRSIIREVLRSDYSSRKDIDSDANEIVRKILPILNLVGEHTYAIDETGSVIEI